MTAQAGEAFVQLNSCRSGNGIRYFICDNSKNLVLQTRVGFENPTDTLKPKANLNRLKLIGKPLRVA